MAQTTRTLNPLPFQDLEPHRFEDLIRQLAYDFRDWHSLEATGRSGADGGADVRGLELVRELDEAETDDQADTVGPLGLSTRIWIFQCKREKSLGPARVEQCVAESIPADAPPPYGFVLGTCADVSDAARRRFRDLMVARGVAEFFIWARGELEDRLFQPANDRLLFAYFGLSLTHRRRSAAASIRSAVAVKKQIRRLIERDESHEESAVGVVLVDAALWGAAGPDHERAGGVRLRRVLREFAASGLIVEDADHYAYLSPDGAAWDALEQVNLVEIAVQRHIDQTRNTFDRGVDHEERCREFWSAHVDAGSRATYRRHRLVPFDRIVAIDPVGDLHRPIPHVYVDFAATGDPYDPDRKGEVIERSERFQRESVDADPSTRVRIFPDVLPADPLSTPWILPAHQEEARAIAPATASRLRELLAPADAEPDSDPEPPPGEEASAGLAEGWIGKVAGPVMAGFEAAISAAGARAKVARTAGKGQDVLALRIWTVREHGRHGAPAYQDHEVSVEVDLERGTHPSARLRWRREFKDQSAVRPLADLDIAAFELLVSKAVEDTLAGRWR